MDEDLFRLLPKVVLHDHLDGGLRPATMLEIADEIGYELPASNALELAGWFFDQASSGSLSSYLTTFDVTTACMQRADDLARVAKEWVIDQAFDGVIAGEVRWAPEQHTREGLSMDEAVEAVADGLRQGMNLVADHGRFMFATQILSGMRHDTNTLEVAKLALRHRDNLVSAFDIAGGEVGNPPTNHLDAFRHLRAHNFYYTIHAGEEGDLSSLHDAIHLCGAMRIGHGVQIAQQIGGEELGDLAQFIRNQRIVLELCPTSNVQTGAVESLQAHPIIDLMQRGFAVTINTDNRLLGQTTLSREYDLVANLPGAEFAHLMHATFLAAQSLFLDHDMREAITAELTNAWFHALTDDDPKHAFFADAADGDVTNLDDYR